MQDFDLIVLGSGPAGERAALHAALHGFKVAVVERTSALGGAGVNTGTLPSKTLKETALYLSGMKQRGLFGTERELPGDPTAAEFLFRERFVVRTESEKYRLELLARHVALFQGKGTLTGLHEIRVEGANMETLRGKHILIATGSSPAHLPGVPFDGQYIHDSDTILQIDRLPRSLCIVGAGVIGCEYATIFAAMGASVTLVNGHDDILPFLDREIVSLFHEELGRTGVELRNRTHIETVAIDTATESPTVRGRCTDGSEIAAELFLYATGRTGNTAELGLAGVGLSADNHGTLHVDANYRTAVPHIYAAGDVIGPPALGSVSMEQGRLAVIHMFGLHEIERTARWLPTGIYTIPEMAAVGLTEEEARAKGLDVFVGRSRYEHNPRGLILGASRGLLKLVCDATSSEVLGVHILGESATELIHYGMELVENREPLSRILGTVFNFPTLHELYKAAAYDLWVRQKGLMMKDGETQNPKSDDSAPSSSPEN